MFLKIQIKYSFSTTLGDITFSTEFVPLGGGQGAEKIVAPMRVPSDIETIKGSYKAEKEGTFVLVFDNTFSWFNSKLLSYKVQLFQVRTKTSALNLFLRVLHRKFYTVVFVRFIILVLSTRLIYDQNLSFRVLLAFHDLLIRPLNPFSSALASLHLLLLTTIAFVRVSGCFIPQQKTRGALTCVSSPLEIAPPLWAERLEAWKQESQRYDLSSITRGAS